MAAGRRRLRLLALGATLVVVLGSVAGYAVLRTPTALTSTGPTAVTGTEASAVFEIAGRTIRQVRYHDGGTLEYRFRLRNGELLPVTVVGIDPGQRDARLFAYRSLQDGAGSSRITIPGHGTREVHLVLRMGGCESLSARAGSSADTVLVRTERLGLSAGTVRVSLPEEIHTGSPREAFCPDSTADSRSPG